MRCAHTAMRTHCDAHTLRCVSAPVRVSLARLPLCCETSDTPGSWAPAPPRCPNRCKIPHTATPSGRARCAHLLGCGGAASADKWRRGGRGCIDPALAGHQGLTCTLARLAALPSARRCARKASSRSLPCGRTAAMTAASSRIVVPWVPRNRCVSQGACMAAPTFAGTSGGRTVRVNVLLPSLAAAADCGDANAAEACAQPWGTVIVSQTAWRLCAPRQLAEGNRVFPLPAHGLHDGQHAWMHSLLPMVPIGAAHGAAASCLWGASASAWAARRCRAQAARAR